MKKIMCALAVIAFLVLATFIEGQTKSGTYIAIGLAIIGGLVAMFAPFFRSDDGDF